MAKKGFFSRLFGSSDESAPEDQIKQGVLEVEGEGAVDPADLDNLLPDTAQGSDGPDLGGEEEDAAAVAMMGGDLPAGAVEPEVQAEAEAEDRQAEDLAAHVSEKDLAALEVEEAVVLGSEDETEAVVAVSDEPGASEAVAAGHAEASDAVSEGAAVAVAASTSVQASETAEKPAKKLSWFERLKQGLSRSSGALGEGISAIFTKRKLDDDTLQDLEDILIQADLGVETAMTITDRLSEGRYNKEVTDREVQEILAEEVDKVLEPVAKPLEISRPASGPHVILMIGVNGAGKTTTIGKLAQKFGAEGKKVMMAAGDTFRAAAIDQLKVWGERTGAPVVAREVGSDAAGLAYDAMAEAKQKDMDVLLIDTAGRLQNRTELMAELEKIVRVIKKHDPAAPHSVLLVLDATTGQNALNQVEVFSRMAGVTGLVMTKLDGTARGGILVAISAKYKVPVHFIGVGEGVDDLEPFASRDFARAIAGL